jgi:ABC-type bacteriocin/lantibiotic exporter with double-glycine peptidase domain
MMIAVVILLILLTTWYTKENRKENRFPFQVEERSEDGGAICLQMIALYHKTPHHRQKLIEWCGADSETGTTLPLIEQAAQRLGYKTYLLSATPANLIKSALFPCIVQLRNGRFVVIYHMMGAHFFIADPAFQKSKVVTTEFAETWIDPSTGEGPVLVLGPERKQPASSAATANPA